jgi:hypothetical protein
VYDFLIDNEAQTVYTAKLFEQVVNQMPVIQVGSGLCVKNQMTFTDEALRNGELNLYEPALPSGFGSSYSASGGMIALTEGKSSAAEDCAQAASEV